MPISYDNFYKDNKNFISVYSVWVKSNAPTDILNGFLIQGIFFLNLLLGELFSGSVYIQFNSNNLIIAIVTWI